MTEFADLCHIQLAATDGEVLLSCRLPESELETAGALLARSIAEHRIGVNVSLHTLWTENFSSDGRIEADSRSTELFTAALLQNVGVPGDEAAPDHLGGLVAEEIWHQIVKDRDLGLGQPLRVEVHDYSATDPGGDGLTVYRPPDEGFVFRLWETKQHTSDEPVRATVNGACRQVRARATSYLARFSLIAQHMTEDRDLAQFYGRLGELWVNRDPKAGVGVSIGTDREADVSDCFSRMSSYFTLALEKHHGHLHLVADFPRLASNVRRALWRGCGLWNEP